jgi:hypothetical protein
MTKRFTPKASTYTVQLASVQAKLALLKAQVQALEAEQSSLVEYLTDFYEEGHTSVESSGRSYLVKFSTSEREYLDQKKAMAIIAKAGKKVPKFTSTLTSFKVVKEKSK